MPFQLSPGVTFTESDLTLIVPTIATTGGGMVGVFQWGPAHEIVQISSERDLAEKFGVPAYDATYARSWMVASNFLKYGNNLKVVRHLGADDKTATAEGSGTVLINSEDSYNLNRATVAALDSDAGYCAKYAGELGNSLRVFVLDNTTEVTPTSTNLEASDDYFDLVGNFDGVPSTSVWAETITGSTGMNDEIHILVVDVGGMFTGVEGTILEKYAFLSKAQNAKATDGTSNYYVDIINNKSAYVWWLKHPENVQAGAGTEWGAVINGNTTASFKLIDQPAASGREDRKVSYTLGGGKTGGITDATSIVTEASVAAAYATHFENGGEVDVSLLLAGAMTATNARAVIDVADSRRDCIAFVSPQTDDVANITTFDLQDALDYRTDLNISSSYAVLDSGYKLQYDKYNDRYLYVPLCADVAGCCVRTDSTNDPWFSPAGFNRGTIKNVVRLAYNPGKADRDELYKKGINPVVSFDGEGTVLFGDKTLLTRPSAFDRINVRRLFIVLEKAISTASKFLLFEFNDEFTRAQFKQLVEPYLREVQGRRGVTDFRVVCDESNNTPAVIDANGFVGDIYIKPNRSINFIQLNFIATPTGVSFEEIGA